MDNSENDNLSWDNLLYLADFFETSSERHMSLLGGEPTLHPQFTEFVLYLLERNFHITIFTSGIMSDKSLEVLKTHLYRYSPERFSFVCNINEPELCPDVENTRQRNFLKAFGSYTTASFNIYRQNFDLDFLFDYINRYGMNRTIRFGLAHPIPGEINTCITAEGTREMAQHFMSFAPSFEKFKVSPNFDCGMPLCVFSDAQIGKLYRLTHGMGKFVCGPAIDIGPDMNVWSCFPLHALQKRSIFEFNSLQEVGQFYSQIVTKIRREEIGGIFETCDSCPDFAYGTCSGGCLAHILSDFRTEAPVRLQEVYL
jgi:cyclic pyranopterin phosphate synthase